MRGTGGVAVVALLAALACAVNPVTGRRELMLLSQEQEIQLGRENDELVIADYGLYDDPGLAGWIEQTGHTMAAASERPQLPWTFRVVDDTIVNAFALPGGYIYMTRDILVYMNSEAEVAGVLGHEIGHVTARHGAQRYTGASLAQIGLGAGSILSSEVRALGGILQTGVGLLFLKFGRDDELQSDQLGVRYAVGAGYDPRRLAAFFRTISLMSESGGGRLPTWLSTHPSPENRVERVLASSEPLVAGRTDLRIGRDAYLRRVDGIVFGPNPRQGVVVDGTFKHPDLLFQVDFPDGWQLQNGKQAVVSAPDDGDVIVGLTVGAMQGASLEAHANAAMQARSATSVVGASTSVAGLPAYRAHYDSTVNEVVVRASDVFIHYGDLIYDLIGYSRATVFGRHAGTIDSWQRSFRRLPRSEADRYNPDRLEVFAAPRAGPLASLVDAGPAASIDTLALLNGVAADARIERGTLIKRVRAGYRR